MKKRKSIEVASQTHERIQELLRTYDLKLLQKEIYYRDLKQEDLEEIRNLHAEWFPLNYPDKFYDTILEKKNVIPIGCFVKLIVTDEKGKEIEKEVLLGSIISRVKEQKPDITEIHIHH